MPAPQPTQENEVVAPAPTWPGFTGAPGSLVCTLKMMFELGNRMPLITCARLPVAGNAGPCEAAEGIACGPGPGSTMAFSAASSAARSVRPEGNLPTWRI